MSRLAYIMGTFPALTETFVVREVEALEQVGVHVEMFSLRRPSALDTEKAEGAAFVPRTTYGPAWHDPRLWAANLRAWREAPVRHVKVLGAMLARTALNPVHCLKLLALFPVAVAFAELMRQRGVTHVHAHWAIYPAAAAYVVSCVLDIPYSFTAHAHDATAIRSLMREKIRRAAFVVTCSAWTQSWLRRLVPDEREKILLNYHGVALDRFVPRLASRLPRPGQLTIASCGSLYPRKGFPYLLEACRLLRDRGWNLDCVVIGDGPMRARLQSFIDRHGLAERVRLVGAVAPSEVVRYYREADVFVLACITACLGWRDIVKDPLLGLEVGLAIPFRPWMDGIPNVLLEAMAMEIPVVSTLVAGIPELIQSGHSGILVPEKDPEALAAAIEELLRDPVRRRELARRGGQVVRERFDRQRTIRQLVEIFSSRSGRPAGHRPMGACGDLRAFVL
jgi:glycosyltransferase involved in cell wall biosynthesis